VQYKAPVCPSVAARTHRGTERRAANIGSSFRMIMGCAVPNIIKIRPKERVRPEQLTNFGVSESHFVNSVSIVAVVYKVRLKKQTSINRSEELRVESSGVRLLK
jgi:hypothetical protein